MASYSAVIDLRVNGLQQLEAVEARVDAVNKLIKQIKPIPNIFDQRDVARVKAVKKELDFVVKAYADGNTVVAKFSGSIAGLNSQLNGFRTIAANAKVGADQFTNALKAAEIASSKLAGAELKRLDTLGDLYTRKPTGGLSAEDQGPSGLTRAVLDLGKTLPKSLAGLRTYANELDRIFTLVEAGSVDFRTLQAEIARVNRQMDIAGGAGPMQGPALPPSMRGGGGGRRGATSPIGGGRGFPGSPGALAAQAENLMLGAGFPLLFGGGPAQVAGGLIGSFIGTGFGGQIAGAAFAQQLADATARITEIGNALDALNIDNLRNSVIYVNAELDTTVRLLIEAGDAQEAQKVAAQSVFEQTGMLPEAVARISDNSNILANTWNQFSAAASGTLSIIGQPFVIALQVITSGLTKILQYSNYILTAAGEWLDKHLGWIAQNPVIQAILARILNGNTAVTEEQQKQTAQLAEATDRLRENVALAAELDRLKEAEVANGTLYGQLLNTELEKEAQLAVLRKEYDDKRREARTQYAGISLDAYMRELDAEEALKRKGIERTEEEKKRLLVLKEADAQRALGLAQQNAQLDIQRNLVQQQLSLVQAYYQAQTTINNIEIQSLERLRDSVTGLDTKLRITQKIYKLEVQNAKIALESSKAQISAAIELAALELKRAELKAKNLEIDLLSAAANKETTSAQLANLQAAVDAGRAGVRIATDTLRFTRAIGEQQLRAAKATYEAAVQAAKLKAQTAGAAAQAERFANAMASAGGGRKLQVGDVVASTSDVPQGIGYSFKPVQGGYEIVSAPAQGTFATGGYVNRPTRALIGEAGPEYIIPRKKVSGFVENWLNGKRGDSAVPNMLDAQRSAMSAERTGATASTVSGPINIQTGPVVQMDGKRYVTLDDMETALQSMVTVVFNSNRAAGTRRYTGVR